MKEKLNEKDVGLLEDAFEFLKHAVADEGHCIGNYMKSKDVEDLNELNKARILRTKIMDLISGDVKGQNWCRVKHLVGKAITLQELSARFLSANKIEEAKNLANEYKDLYLSYLKAVGVNKDNAVFGVTGA